MSLTQEPGPTTDPESTEPETPATTASLEELFRLAVDAGQKATAAQQAAYNLAAFMIRPDIAQIIGALKSPEKLAAFLEALNLKAA
ncbi:MAG: hypothetical protein QNK37_20610 [Acidobacteriota bacterium]|nr:hypothetical protein [Acidobacteriota bacterium]